MARGPKPVALSLTTTERETLQALVRRRSTHRMWRCEPALCSPVPILTRYLAFYNGRRPHSSLNRRTPDQAYFTPLPQLNPGRRSTKLDFGQLCGMAEGVGPGVRQSKADFRAVASAA